MALEKEIEYSEITTHKVGRLWQAKTETHKPIKSEVTMTGISEEIAKQKLINFLENKPYKHLDNL